MRADVRLLEELVLPQWRRKGFAFGLITFFVADLNASFVQKIFHITE